MAAHIARRCYLLCFNVSAGTNVIPQLVKPRGAVIRDVNNTFQLNAGYGTRGTDTTQDVQVHVPVGKYTNIYLLKRASTKAEVRFHVQTADWIPGDVRQKILEKNKSRINKAGELLVTSELSRSQQRNFGDCIQKISAIITDASEKPHEPTAEDIALRAIRLEKRNKERLKQKKIHSVTKQSRRVDFD